MKKDLNNFQAPDPKEYWGQAEKMLDQHFIQKRRKKRLAIFFIAIASMIGTAYLYTNFTGVNHDKKIVNTDAQKSNTKSIIQANTRVEKPMAIQPDKTQSTQELNNNSRGENRTQEESTKEPSRKLKDKSAILSNNLADALDKSKSLKNIGNNVKVITKKEPVSTVITSNPDASNKLLASESIKKDENIPSDKEIKNSIQATKNQTESFANRIDILPPFQRSLSGPDSKEKFVYNSHSPNNSEIIESPEKSKLALSFYASAHSVSKSIDAKIASHYLERREQEEKNIIAPALGLSLVWINNNFSASLGLEYSYLGEKIAYGSYSRQEVYTHTGNWQTFNIWVTDTDTAYVSGLRWFLETQVNQLDSQYVSRTDTTVENVQDKKLSSKNGTNKFYYVEIPLELRYQFPMKRFAFGISVAVSPAFLTSEKGYYIKEDQSGLEQVSVSKPLKAFIVNGSLGLDVSYLLRPGINVFLGPQFKTNLGTITNSDFPVSQRYTKMGLKLGVTYQIK